MMKVEIFFYFPHTKGKRKDSKITSYCIAMFFSVPLLRFLHISLVGTLWTSGAGGGSSSARWWSEDSPAFPACLSQSTPTPGGQSDSPWSESSTSPSRSPWSTSTPGSLCPPWSDLRSASKCDSNILISSFFFLQAMGISSFVAGIGLLVFPYINSLVSDHGQLVIDW